MHQALRVVRDRFGWALLLLAGAVTASTAPTPARGARPERLALRHLGLQIEGPPVTLLPADLDADGRRDLLVVTAYTYWGQSTEQTTTEVDGRLFEEVRVRPTLVDRRQMRPWLASPDGTYRAAGPPQAVPGFVHAFEPGPAKQAVLAITDHGVSEVTYDAQAEGALQLTDVFEADGLLAGSQTLLPGSRFMADVNADGRPDLLFPAREGLAIHLARDGRLDPEPVAIIALPGDASGKDGVAWRRYPLPVVEDVQGDGLPDLVFLDRGDDDALTAGSEHDVNAVTVIPGIGGGHFGVPVKIELAAPQARDVRIDTDRKGMPVIHLPAHVLPGSLSYFGDLDGDGMAELATQEQIEADGDGLRAELRNAKRPHYRHRFYRLDAGLHVARRPYLTFQAEGYPFDFNWLDASPGGFVDLDGDGRKELVTIGLDFSLWQAPKILIARTIGVGIDFHVWRQQVGGAFHEVPDARMRGKFKIDLSPVRIIEFAQFAGDVDGDGHIDFLHFGSSRTIDIHRGGEGCRFPAKADASIRLDRAPKDPGLVRVRDIDGDGRSDLVVVTPLRAEEKGESRPTRLEFYLTGNGR
ncbi:MAG: FG-GAP repeat domain-containing protein [Acidobacteriota bacterium]